MITEELCQTAERTIDVCVADLRRHADAFGVADPDGFALTLLLSVAVGLADEEGVRTGTPWTPQKFADLALAIATAGLRSNVIPFRKAQ